MNVTQLKTYDEAHAKFEWSMLWDLFDGDRDGINIAHECLDRHPGSETAVRLKFADGHTETYSFEELSVSSARFAHYLEACGIKKGDRVAIMLEPCFEFYTALFGTMKAGAIAVPLFTLFGPEGLKPRLEDSLPKLLVTTLDIADRMPTGLVPEILLSGIEFTKVLDGRPGVYQTHTTGQDPALFQYTSGTTRALPEAVRHTHRSCVTLMLAALFGLGLKKGDRYFCPSSPAWGHGLWHGTISPLALGLAAGAYSGRFSETRFLEALEEFAITNIAAAPTVFRRIKNSGLIDNYRLKVEKISYTGEPMDSGTFKFIEEKFATAPRSMYGSTETGVVLANFPEFRDWPVKPGSLGRTVPGWEVGIIDSQGQPVPPGEHGEIAVKRKGDWFRVKDMGYMDEDGYFWHKGRSDDVIISAGWTISAIEVEDCLLGHPLVVEAAVIGVPDPERGLVVKAFVKASQTWDGLDLELQEYVRQRLSRHEYPRLVEFLDELPKTPAGKIKRDTLRNMEKQKQV